MIRVTFWTTDGGQIRTLLADAEYNDSAGMPEGVRAPAAGTRYAMPLTIVYRRSEPSVALAAVDAREWVADRKTPRCNAGMLVGGLAVALVLLSRGARRRGLA